jgi:hypothetical protein
MTICIHIGLNIRDGSYSLIVVLAGKLHCQPMANLHSSLSLDKDWQFANIRIILIYSNYPVSGY